MTTLTLDLMTPGSYEYLSSVSGDALSGMKGILAVT
jgi:plastocyanin